jgi:hypothetical protein
MDWNLFIVVVLIFVGGILAVVYTWLTSNALFAPKQFGASLISSLIASVILGTTFKFATPGTLTALDILFALASGFAAEKGGSTLTVGKMVTGLKAQIKSSSPPSVPQQK